MINKKISPAQLGCMMFLATVYFVSIMTSDLLDDNFTDSITSVVVSFVMGGILALPLLLSDHTRQRELSTADKILIPFYAIFFLFSGVMELSYMISILNNTILPEENPWILAAGLILPAAYSAYKGIEAMGRGSLILTAFYIISFVLVIIGSMEMIDLSNLKFPFNDGGKDMIKNSFIIFARSAVLPQMAVVFRFLNRGRRDKLIYYIWHSLAAIIIVISLFMIILCLGGFADSQQFPSFTLSTAATLEPLQRLDIIFTSSAAAALTVKLGLSIFGIVTLVGAATSKISRELLVISASLPIMVSAVLVASNNKLKIGMYTLPAVFILIILLGTAVPLIEDIRSRTKEKK